MDNPNVSLLSELKHVGWKAFMVVAVITFPAFAIQTAAFCLTGSLWSFAVFAWAAAGLLVDRFTYGTLTWDWLQIAEETGFRKITRVCTIDALLIYLWPVPLAGYIIDEAGWLELR